MKAPYSEANAGQVAQHSCLVDRARSRRALIHLLQGNQVRLDGMDQSGDALEIELPVQPDAVVDVVAEHPKDLTLVRRGVGPVPRVVVALVSAAAGDQCKGRGQNDHAVAKASDLMISA